METISVKSSCYEHLFHYVEAVEARGIVGRDYILALHTGETMLEATMLRKQIAFFHRSISVF